MKVCYFGAYDPLYARDQIFLNGLKLNGVKVVECHISPRIRLWKQNFALLHEYLKLSHDFDAFVVARNNQFAIPLAKFLSILSGKPIIFDIFFSLHDTYVHDRKHIKQRSLKASLFYFMDRVGLRFPDLVFADTQQHLRYYHERFHVPEERLRIVYVGCDTSLFHPFESRHDSQKFIVTFTGTFIPLHGIEYILRAAKLLESEQDIHFELVGKGQTYRTMKSLSEELALRNCTFLDPVSIAELPALMARGDTCLGIFGESEKAKRVIPNKVFQALAMKKVVITGDSPAIRELFTHEEHLLLCKFSDEHALAEAIVRLKKDRSLRTHLAENGYRLVTEHFSPPMIGKQVKELIESIL